MNKQEKIDVKEAVDDRTDNVKETELSQFDQRKKELTDKFYTYADEIKKLEKLDKGDFSAMCAVFSHLLDNPVSINELISDCIIGSKDVYTSESSMNKNKVLDAIDVLVKRKYIEYTPDGNSVISIQRDIYIDEMIPEIPKQKLQRWIELKLLKSKIEWCLASNENNKLMYCIKTSKAAFSETTSLVKELAAVLKATSEAIEDTCV